MSAPMAVIPIPYLVNFFFHARPTKTIYADLIKMMWSPIRSGRLLSPER